MLSQLFSGCRLFHLKTSEISSLFLHFTQLCMVAQKSIFEKFENCLDVWFVVSNLGKKHVHFVGVNFEWSFLRETALSNLNSIVSLNKKPVKILYPLLCHFPKGLVAGLCFYLLSSCESNGEVEALSKGIRSLNSVNSIKWEVLMWPSDFSRILENI